MVTRNQFFFAGLGAALSAGVRPSPVEAAPQETAGMTARQAAEELRAGYRRFKSGHVAHTDYTEQREKTAAQQRPFAVILSCSDSRVPPEILFDQGIGKLFIIRVAGNVADDIGIGSIEYAVANFGCPLLLVLGHTNCGAVKAAVDALDSSHSAPGHIQAVVEAILPAAKRARAQTGDVYLNATKDNAISVASKLRASEPIIGTAVRENRLRVAAALYSLQLGSVTLL